MKAFDGYSTWDEGMYSTVHAVKIISLLDVAKLAAKKKKRKNKSKKRCISKK